MASATDAVIEQRSDISFLGVGFSSLNWDETIDAIRRMSRGKDFQYVVTPNVDHIVQLASHKEPALRRSFRSAYASAALRLCDSRILVKLARIKGITLPLAAGSDLTAFLMHNVFGAEDKVAIIGSTEDTLAHIRSLCPHPRFVQHIPPMDMIDNPGAIVAIRDFLAQEQAHYVLFATGAPRSEIVAETCMRDGRLRGVGLCVGASIDFITGSRKRAPRWVQALSLEWAFRLLSEPRRLWRRYLVEGPKIFAIFMRGGIG